MCASAAARCSGVNPRAKSRWFTAGHKGAGAAAVAAAAVGVAAATTPPFFSSSSSPYPQLLLSKKCTMSSLPCVTATCRADPAPLSCVGK
jgi:hypothetical protein